MLRFGFRAGKGRFAFVMAAGSGRTGMVDLDTKKRIVPFKNNLKHHTRRLAFTWYEKKL